MCNSNLKLKFCTCEKEKPETTFSQQSKNLIDKLDKETYLRKEFVWTIAKYTGPLEIAIEGMIVGPTDKLSNELNTTLLLDELNNNLELFDFDYLPKIGDNIIVKSKYVHPPMKDKPRPELLNEHMSFIFKEKGWQNDCYNPFQEATKDILTGKVKLIR